jgi:signal transduction histidine kinase
LAEERTTRADWVGRLVRVLVVFRAVVLLVTVITLPAHEYTGVAAAAIMLAALISYLPLRHWERIASTVSRHPTYLAVEVLIATFILGATGVQGPFFYFTLGTGALAGVIYGRRGAIPFSALLVALYELVAVTGLPTLQPHLNLEIALFEPLLYPVAVVAGIMTRDTIERGVRAETLLLERTTALSAERERLRVARELHDSLAKTVEGLALTASILPSRCRRAPEAAAALAGGLAADARQAALEARMLMTDLRPDTAAQLSVGEALRQRAEAVAERSGVELGFAESAGAGAIQLPAQRTHELSRIVGEAMSNAVTHGGAGRVEVSLDSDSQGELVVSVSDDGDGLSEPVDLEKLKAAGHFGLAGMYERARSIGGRLRIQRGEQGVAVSVRVPVAAADDAPSELTGRPRRLRLYRRRSATPQPAASQETT